MPVKICFCYAHEDEAFLNLLKRYLKVLQKPMLIEEGFDRNINAGTEREQEISEQLNTAQIILLLVSPDFLNSDYSYRIEMQQALKRHEQGEAKVIPIILRHVYWQGTPFAKLQVLPENAEPMMSSRWISPYEAFYHVIEGILKVAEGLIEHQTSSENNINAENDVIRSASAKNFTSYPDKLTRREIEVLRLVAVGMSNGQIAEHLVLSPHTVNVHISSIFKKMGTKTRQETILSAHKLLSSE